MLINRNYPTIWHERCRNFLFLLYCVSLLREENSTAEHNIIIPVNIAATVAAEQRAWAWRAKRRKKSSFIMLYIMFFGCRCAFWARGRELEKVGRRSFCKTYIHFMYLLVWRRHISRQCWFNKLNLLVNIYSLYICRI